MKVLIVYAHPSPRSFTHAILDSFTAGLAEVGHGYEVVDLYAIKFNPCLNEDEFAQLMRGEIPADIRDQQQKVSDADGIVFIHPIWWTGPPAILKGWVDRVLSLGFAYVLDKDDRNPIGLLKKEKALVINTARVTAEDDQKTGLTECLKRIEDEGLFRFCGFEDVKHVVFHNVRMTDDETRQAYLEEARNLGKTF